MNRDRMRLLLTHPRNGRSMPLKFFFCGLVKKKDVQRVPDHDSNRRTLSNQFFASTLREQLFEHQNEDTI
jgi:hypothetical protein